jgi:hypothetical protein
MNIHPVFHNWLRFNLVILSCLMVTLLWSNAHTEEVEKNNLLENAKWMFQPGAEYTPGSKGNFRLDNEEGKATGIFFYDFSEGGAYAGVGTDLKISEDVIEIRFKVKAKDAMKIVVAIIDFSDQIHQYACQYTNPDEWQIMRIDLNRSSNYHYQGKNDGTLYYPTKNFGFIINKQSVQNLIGEVYFSDIDLLK